MVVNIYNTNKKYSIIYADPPWTYKTYKESQFIRLYLRGSIAGTLFKTNEHYYDNDDKYKNMVVLQMILTSDPDYVLSEIIRKEDFEKIF